MSSTERHDRQTPRGDRESLRLRPLRVDDEESFRAAHQALQGDDFPFGLGYTDGMSWAAYLDQLGSFQVGVELWTGFVPATFLVAEVGGELVGRVSIRHELNEFLDRVGGHIGFCVVPNARRRGYATEILRRSVVMARDLGIERILVTCAETNVGSATVIERCGGVLESVVQTENSPPTRRYWIG